MTAEEKALEQMKLDLNAVVHCKDCKYLMFSDCYGECRRNLDIVSPDGFCSQGERRDGT